MIVEWLLLRNMPRGKQGTSSNQETKNKTTDDTKKTKQVQPPKQAIQKKNDDQDSSVKNKTPSCSLQTCPAWMKDMIANIANELCEKKMQVLKEEWKEDMEEEVKWSLIAHFGEIEELTDEMKEVVKKNNKEITSQLEKCTREIQSCKVQPELTNLKEEIEKRQESHKKQQRRIERLEHENWQKSTEIRKLKAKLDDVEQHSNANDVQIVGLPENSTSEEDIEAIVTFGKQKLGVNMKASDIEHTYRLGKPKDHKPRDIIVNFCKKSTREKFYQNRRASANQGDPTKNIYVNDHLTEHRRHLLYVARQLYKSNKIKAAWSEGGNVLIRKTEGDNPIQIHDHEDLAEAKHSITGETDISESDS